MKPFVLRNGRDWVIQSLLYAIWMVLALRMVQLHVLQKNFLKHQGDARTVRTVTQWPYRGMLLDRNGEPLAISTPVVSIWMNPQEIDGRDARFEQLVSELGLSFEQTLEKALAALDRKKEFLYLKRRLPPEVGERIKARGIPGIYVQSEYRRFYPAGEVTAHVLGFTDMDDQGQEGLERTFNTFLGGEPGQKRVIRDRKGREVEFVASIKEQKPGYHLVLALDKRLQYLAYRELKHTVTQHRAAAGTVVIIDVPRGEIVGMVNQPSYNPNAPIQIQSANFRNRAVTDVFEPGSVMKTFSVLNALQSGRYEMHSLIDTSPGKLWIGGKLVQEVQQRDYGTLDLAGILQKSSNVGVAKLTLSLTAEDLFETYQKLGFGQPVGTHFPGESAGSLQCPSKNALHTLATMAFGYSMSATPLQLAQAMAIIGSGGIKRPLSFLKREEIPKGERILESRIATAMQTLLAEAVEQSGSNAKVPGIRVGGKTGTARKLSKQGGYSPDQHVALFTGLVPAHGPRYAIVVIVDDPKGEAYYGNQVAAPLFVRIAEGIVRLGLHRAS